MINCPFCFVVEIMMGHLDSRLVQLIYLAFQFIHSFVLGMSKRLVTNVLFYWPLALLRCDIQYVKEGRLVVKVFYGISEENDTTRKNPILWHPICTWPLALIRCGFVHHVKEGRLVVKYVLTYSQMLTNICICMIAVKLKNPYSYIHFDKYNHRQKLNTITDINSAHKE